MKRSACSNCGEQEETQRATITKKKGKRQTLSKALLNLYLTFSGDFLEQKIRFFSRALAFAFVFLFWRSLWRFGVRVRVCFGVRVRVYERSRSRLRWRVMISSAVVSREKIKFVPL